MKRIASTGLLALLLVGASHAGIHAQSNPSVIQEQIVGGLAAAATDCIARHSLNQPDVLEAYRAHNLRPITDRVWPLCKTEIDHLSKEYAYRHGFGTGWAFVDGPYRKDVPRAVLERLQPELDRRLGEDGRFREEQQNAQRSADLLGKRMYDCTRGALVKLVRSKETADVLATAALTICRKEATDAIEATVRLFRLKFPNVSSKPDDREFRDRVQRSIRERVLTDAVAELAEQNTPPSPSQQPPSSAAEPSGPSNEILGKALLTCLDIVSKSQKQNFVETDGLVQVMAELCRPEIEWLAREMFLADTSVPLDRARERALKFAIEEAARMVGARRGA